MKSFKTVANHVRYLSTAKSLLAGLFVLVLGGLVIGATVASNQAAVAADSSNDIIRGGFSTNADFVAKYKANATGDLPAIYSAYGLNPGDIDRFGSSAVAGVTCKDGTVKVNGAVVATNASSLGRNKKNGDSAVSIGGKTYYSGPNSTAFASDCLSVHVLMNNGQFQMAIIKDCANPVKATPTPKPPVPPTPPAPVPAAACVDLNVSQVSRTNFKMDARASTSNGATISRYDFYVYTGAGAQVSGKSVPATAGQASTTFDITSEGTYLARVYAITSAGNKTADTCVKPFAVTAEPVAACESLTLTKQNRTTFKLDAKAAADKGATISNYTFSVKDASGKEVTSKNIASTAKTASHTVTVNEPGTYKATVVVKTSLGEKSAPDCEKSLTVTPPTCEDTPNKPECQPPKECLPGIPEGDARCTPPAECKPGIPVGDARCVPPVIPATGPIDTLSSIFGISSIAGVGFSWFRSRRNLFMK